MAYDDVDEKHKLPREMRYTARKLADQSTAINATKFTEQQLQQGRDVYNLACQAYPRSRVFLNCNTKCMDVKIEAPQVQDKISANAAAFNEYCQLNGFTVQTTAAKAIKIKFNFIK